MAHFGNQNAYKVERWREEDHGHDTPCWTWLLSKDELGYAKAAETTAYRLVWEEERGPLGDLELHHLCTNTSCVNPDHLEPVTRKQHRRRHARITEADIERIRMGGERAVDLAAALNISPSYISNIRAGRVWV